MAGQGGRRATTWQPGQSGNPGGRPRVLKDVQALARRQTEAAVGVLTEIMNDADAPPAARVSAAQALLDRGWGRNSIMGEGIVGVGVIQVVTGIPRRPGDPLPPLAIEAAVEDRTPVNRAAAQ